MHATYVIAFSRQYCRWATDVVWSLAILKGMPAINLEACAGGLGAVFRTVLETMRTLFVWLVDLLLFHIALGMGRLFPKLSL